MCSYNTYSSIFKFYLAHKTVYFMFLQLEDSHNYGSGPLPKTFFETHTPAGLSGFPEEMYLPCQHVSSRHDLTPGEYVIVPSTKNQDQEGKYLLRLFTEKPLAAKWIFTVFSLQFSLLIMKFSSWPKNYLRLMWVYGI